MKGPQPSTDGATTTGEIEGLGQPVSPELQEAYARMVLAGSKILYSEETGPKIVDMLQQGETPEAAIGSVVAFLVTTLDDQSGNTVPDEVLLAPVAEFAEQVGEIAQVNGLFEVDEALLHRGAMAALLELGPTYGIDDDTIAEYIDSLPADARQKAAEKGRQYATAPRPGGGGQPAQGGNRVQ